MDAEEGPVPRPESVERVSETRNVEPLPGIADSSPTGRTWPRHFPTKPVGFALDQFCLDRRSFSRESSGSMFEAKLP